MEMTASSTIQLRPAPGYTAVELLAEGSIKQEGSPVIDEAIRVLTSQHPEHAETIRNQLEEARELREGFSLGRVVEVGPPVANEPQLAHAVDDHIVFPATEGLTLWGRTMVLNSRIVGWFRLDDLKNEPSFLG